MSNTGFKVRFDENGDIVDILGGGCLKSTPEEKVRQRFIETLINEYHYPANTIRREVPIQHGSKELRDNDGNPVRADIVVYASKADCLNRDQGKINFVVECKRNKVEDGYAQLVSYIFNTSANGGVWTNGDGTVFYRRENKDGIQVLEETPGLPRCGQGWEDGRTPRIGELERPRNVRRLLAMCHNRLYGRGMENADSDLTMDMVRILLAKIYDETVTSDTAYPHFWITPEQYKSEDGRAAVAKTIRSLFHEYAEQYPTVFDKDEDIAVGDSTLVEAASVLQDYSFVSREDDADDWDLMGAAYEQFTHVTLKRQQGQFFTNRLVVKAMVDMLDPDIADKVLDPAGGSGGFATAAFRYKRRKAIDGTKPGSPQRERRLGLCKNSVFLVEISKRLVKIAKTAMLLTGDGNTGMTQGNSLDKYSNLDGWITSHCPKGTPDIIITNPPFSGQKTESMMMDPDILKLFGFGHKPDPEGTFPTITDDDDRDAGHGTLLIRQAPELLFLERCIDWLKPGGRIGIVLPKGILDNRTYINYRRWMLSRCKVDAVVTLHKNTFEPDTGVRTCVLFLSKPLEDDPVPGDYTIFMAQSRRVGKDSKGEPVFALDEKGSATSELDEDLTQIAEAYKTFRDIGTFTESETCFTAERGELDDNLNLNPQHYSPELNATLEKVSKFDDKPDWSVTTIGQLDKNIRIYMGPRWSSRSLVVEDPSDTTNLTPYLTANGALEQRRMTVKWFDMSRATDKQKECVRMLRVQKGDILISRSGTIGKVTYATRILADKYVISDDLVRVRVPDENMRAYLLAFLMSSTAMNLMKLDEFGSVQQHLQPRHIWGLPVPVPDSWEQVSPIIDAGKGMISAMEQTSLADESLRTNGFDSLIE